MPENKRITVTLRPEIRAAIEEIQARFVKHNVMNPSAAQVVEMCIGQALRKLRETDKKGE